MFYIQAVLIAARNSGGFGAQKYILYGNKRYAAAPFWGAAAYNNSYFFKLKYAHELVDDNADDYCEHYRARSDVSHELTARHAREGGF